MTISIDPTKITKGPWRGGQQIITAVMTSDDIADLGTKMDLEFIGLGPKVPKHGMLVSPEMTDVVKQVTFGAGENQVLIASISPNNGASGSDREIVINVFNSTGPGENDWVDVNPDADVVISVINDFNSEVYTVTISKGSFSDGYATIHYAPSPNRTPLAMTTYTVTATLTNGNTDSMNLFVDSYLYTFDLIADITGTGSFIWGEWDGDVPMTITGPIQPAPYHIALTSVNGFPYGTIFYSDDPSIPTINPDYQHYRLLLFTNTITEEAVLCPTVGILTGNKFDIQAGSYVGALGHNYFIYALPASDGSHAVDVVSIHNDITGLLITVTGTITRTLQ